MVDADTGRLEYLYLPEPDEFVRERSVIRDIASVWHIEMLEGFLGRDELRPVAATSLRHYCGNVAERDGH
ncbi:MAG: hypothetical protein GWO02_20375, partial [Gammaproteobacteria bacterium]|nr:hypothetical protein [Gammaproteobacteria bacterium]